VRKLAAVLAAVLAACAVPIETVFVPADNAGWKPAHASDRIHRTLVEFVPVDESIGAWSRMFTIQFMEGVRESPRAVMQALQSRMRARCAAARWDVLSEDASSVAYEWSIHGCEGQSDQVEVARLLQGNDGVHRIAYTQKARAMDAAEREKWVTAFAGAYVVKGSARVAVAPPAH
jgi:hypothetical protein